MNENGQCIVNVSCEECAQEKICLHTNGCLSELEGIVGLPPLIIISLSCGVMIPLYIIYIFNYLEEIMDSLKKCFKSLKGSLKRMPKNIQGWLIQPIKDFMQSFDLTGKLLVSIFFNLVFNTADVGSDVYQAIKHYL